MASDHRRLNSLTSGPAADTVPAVDSIGAPPAGGALLMRAPAPPDRSASRPLTHRRSATSYWSPHLPLRLNGTSWCPGSDVREQSTGPRAPSDCRPDDDILESGTLCPKCPCSMQPLATRTPADRRDADVGRLRNALHNLHSTSTGRSVSSGGSAEPSYRTPAEALTAMRGAVEPRKR